MKLSPLLSALKTTFLTGKRSTRIAYKGTSTVFTPGETVLEALLRAGHKIPNSCRAGACQACLMVADGPLPDNAQRGLDSSQKALNQFLACQFKPESAVQIKDTDDLRQSLTATLVEKSWLNTQVLRLRFEGDLAYRAGQYLTLWKDDQTARSYSLASVPGVDPWLEFHVRVIAGGQFSSWLASDLEPGQTLEMQGPLGKCFYSCTPEQPLLLAAIGTGLAPIYGILREALHCGHTGKIDVLIGAAQPEGFYLIETLGNLARTHSNLRVHFLCANGTSEYAQTANMYDYSKELFPSLEGHRIFLCGAPSFVRKMQRQCFMAGANMSDISADAFVEARSG